jgi:hypothetical protein
MTMNRSAFVKLSLVLVITLLLGFVANAYMFMESKTRLTPKEDSALSDSDSGMKGITYRTYHENRLTAMIRADRFGVDERKFWAFNIRPFKDAVLENAVIQVYLNRDGESADDGNVLSFDQDLLNIARQASDKKGLVTRGVISGFLMEIHEPGGASIVIKAKKAYVHAGKKILKMVNVSMEDVSSGKLIRTRSANWNNKEQVFEVAGNYILQTNDSIIDGKMARIDLDFDITPLRHSDS